MRNRRFVMQLTILAVAILAVTVPAAAVPAVAAAQPAGLDRVRQDVEPSGRVKNVVLAQDSGWQIMHAFTWAIELEQAGRRGEFRTVDAGREFHHGERFRLRIQAATDLYIYVLVHNADGSQEVLLPSGPERVPLVQAGGTEYLPGQGAFRFSPPAGTERMRLIASPQQLPWVAPRDLWKLQNGDHLTLEQQDALAQLRSVQARSIDDAKVRQSQMRSVESIAAATRDIQRQKLSRGAEVIAAETVDEVHQVTYASGSSDARFVIVEEIVLKHVP